MSLFTSKTQQALANIDKAEAAGKMTPAEAREQRHLARVEQVIASSRARKYGSATQ